MKFHWEKTIEDAKESWQRFPFVLLSALLALLITFTLIEISNSGKKVDEQTLINLGYGLYCCMLGVALFFSVTLLAEKRQWKPLLNLSVSGGVVLGLVILYFIFPKEPQIITFSRLFLWAIFAHLLVAFLPYINKGENFGFWAYNQVLLGRFILAAFYSIILYVGISFAFLAITILFSVKIDWIIYARLGVLCNFLHTWFFLAGIPKDLKVLNESVIYPQPLSILTRYILLPLLLLYTLILYAYGIKLTLEWHLPVTWVMYLILIFSIVGIFTFLLIYPLQNQPNEGWINLATRSFYIIIIPLLIMDFIAVGKRILDFGFTEPRYYVLVIDLWLLGMVVHYAILKRYQYIKIIPISLASIVFLSSFGPWSAFSVAEMSQESRFDNLLKKYQVFQSQDKIKPNIEWKKRDAREIEAIYSFFEIRQREKVIKQKFEKAIKFSKKKDKFEDRGILFNALNISTDFKNELGNNSRNVDFYANTTFINVKSYDYYFKINPTNIREESFSKKFEDIKLTINKDYQAEIMIGKALYELDLKEKLLACVKKHLTDNVYSIEIPKDENIIEFSNEKINFKVFLVRVYTNVKKEKEDNKIELSSFEAEGLLKVK
jgi:hypothetical protein